MSGAMVTTGGQSEKLSKILSIDSVQAQFRNALGDAAPLFTASIIDTANSSKELAQCDPRALIQEALKAAVLRLPISRGLGFAYIVPRRDHGVWTPQMQIGWKGWVQLAQRTGQYRYINAGPVYEGERASEERITGEVRIEGKATSGEIVGFFAYFELLNGFRKATYWTMDRVHAHRDRYVQKWDRPGGAWVTHPVEMAQKTVLSNLLRKYGVLSVEMQQTIEAEVVDEAGLDNGPPVPPPLLIEPSDPQSEMVEQVLASAHRWAEAHKGVYPEGWPSDEQIRAGTLQELSGWLDRVEG